MWGQGIFPAQSLWPQYDQMAPLELPKSHSQHSVRAHKANSHHAGQPPRLTRQPRVLVQDASGCELQWQKEGFVGVVELSLGTAHPGLAFGVQVNSASCWRVAQGVVQGHASA